jgi:hypothetical protein
MRSMPPHRMRRLLVALIGMPYPYRKVGRSSLSSDGATVAFTTTGHRASLRDVRSRPELRQRCQAAPDMTATMDYLRRGVGVGDDQPHPPSPRALTERRNAVPKGPSSLSPTCEPRTSRPPSVVTPLAITTARLTTRPSILALRRWRTRTGRRCGPGSGAERRYLGVQLATDLAGLGLGASLYTQGRITDI